MNVRLYDACWILASLALYSIGAKSTNEIYSVHKFDSGEQLE